ncbi:c-type cytochrome domain-containing protein, partial [Singulisphaera rosea]
MPAIPARAMVALALLFHAGSAKALEDEASGEGAMFFEKNIRPILVEHCYSCHSEGAKKIRGGLRLDSKVGWQKGGDLGPSIKPGEPDQSLLIEAVRYKEGSLQMPPKGKLGDREVALLTRWIA